MTVDDVLLAPEEVLGALLGRVVFGGERWLADPSFLCPWCEGTHFAIREGYVCCRDTLGRCCEWKGDWSQVPWPDFAGDATALFHAVDWYRHTLGGGHVALFVAEAVSPHDHCSVAWRGDPLPLSEALFGLAVFCLHPSGVWELTVFDRSILVATCRALALAAARVRGLL